MRPNTSVISQRTSNFLIAGLIVITAFTMAVVLAIGDLGIGAAVAFLPVVVGLIALVIANPYFGIIFYLHYSFSLSV